LGGLGCGPLISKRFEHSYCKANQANYHPSPPKARAPCHPSHLDQKDARRPAGVILTPTRATRPLLPPPEPRAPTPTGALHCLRPALDVGTGAPHDLTHTGACWAWVCVGGWVWVCVGGWVWVGGCGGGGVGGCREQRQHAEAGCSDPTQLTDHKASRQQGDAQEQLVGQLLNRQDALVVEVEVDGRVAVDRQSRCASQSLQADNRERASPPPTPKPPPPHPNLTCSSFSMPSPGRLGPVV